MCLVLALRLGERDAFPAGDVVLRRALHTVVDNHPVAGAVGATDADPLSSGALRRDAGATSC